MTGLLPERRRDRGVKGNSHFRAPRMEKDIAARLGGTTVKGSGSGSEKGDVRIKGVARVEAKCTSKASFRLTREMVEKIENAALAAGEVPAIVVEFLDQDGVTTHSVAVVPLYVLDKIVEG